MRPKVGVGIFIKKDNKILLGKRKGSHGSGTWSCPGGHLEFGESVEECAQREIFEETGLTIKSFIKSTFTNDIFHEENKHYITVYLLAELEDGEPTVMEPEKCYEWQWFEWSDLPEPLFIPIQNLLKENFEPFK